MTYYLEHSDWMNSTLIPEGMNLDMLNNLPQRLDTLLKPALKRESQDKIVIDLGAGTGILGLYALDNGAKFVYFVERDPQMFYILENVLTKKLDNSKFKLINKDIESLSVDDFDCGTPDLIVSEFYGPRLFDEGYVNYTKHLRSLFPNCYFIPEIFKVDFYLLDCDKTQSIWPHDDTLIPHFKFMYKEKGFAKYIEFDHNKLTVVDSIIFNANAQTFKNEVNLKYDLSAEKLLVGKAWATHNELKQVYTTFGWFLDSEDKDKQFKIYFDTENYYNPRKIEI